MVVVRQGRDAMRWLACLLWIALAWPASAAAMCFAQAAAAYAVPEHLLRAIAQVETGLRALPPSRNPDGSVDTGIMRINSGWLPVLRQYGISDLALQDACQNILVGAWILAGNRQRFGDNWTAVGAYNVGCKKLDAQECERRRGVYSWKVYCALNHDADARCLAARRYASGARASVRAGGGR
jgi:soluble lytic murein transglycosylase-like protein